jgi:hypothetical protein
VSQTSCVVLQPFPLINKAGLHRARVLREKHDHIAVGERVFMVFDATIRPTAGVGLQPGAGLKRFTVRSQSGARKRGIVHAGGAVALQACLGEGGWASRTGGQRSKRRVSCGP